MAAKDLEHLHYIVQIFNQMFRLELYINKNIW